MHDAPHEQSHPLREIKLRLVRQASRGANEWNRGRAPEDWWKEIENRHGHVGPWNVLGFRMGSYVLRQMGSPWGSHEFIITAHIPPSTPYSCILDGLAVATGNSEGRLDLLWSEVALPELIHVSVRRAEDRRLIMVLLPHEEYLNKISQGGVGDLERQARECEQMPDEALFSVRWVEPKAR